MKMKQLIGLALVALLSMPMAKAAYKVIPQPQSVTYSGGVLTFSTPLTVAFSKAAANEADLLKQYFEQELGLKVKLSAKANGAPIVLKIDEQFKTEKSGGYQLVVGENITITSNNTEGIFNGIQTLRQIVTKTSNGIEVEKGTINDAPAYSWRAFMLDEGRNFHGMEVVKGLLDEMALLKMNVFHWHLTEDQGWRIEIKKYPLLTKVGAFRDSTEINHFNSNKYDGKACGGFYTQKQIKEIVAYAAERHITIVPEVEMPGHASASIAAYPWLGTKNHEIKVPCNFGVKYDVYNVANPRVLQFLEDVIDEVIALFPSAVFHIGGDEIRYDHWKESDEVNEYMKKHNINSPAELQVSFTNNISNLLAKKNRRMMGWNEITGEQINEFQSSDDTQIDQKLNPNTIVQFWKGEADNIRKTVEKGYDIVNSYHYFTYLDYSYGQIPLNKAYNFDPMPAGLAPELRHKVLGVGCQMWGEFIPTIERLNFQAFPRIAAYSEIGWTKTENKNYDRFLESLKPILKRWDAKGIKYGPIAPTK